MVWWVISKVYYALSESHSPSLRGGAGESVISVGLVIERGGAPCFYLVGKLADTNEGRSS